MNSTLQDIGDQFQEQTKYHREKMPLSPLNWSSKPDTYKVYPPGTETINLSTPASCGTHPFWSLIARRRSRRDFIEKPLTLDQLSHLLWATQGTTMQLGDIHLRAAPSAGALYPIETYLLVNRVNAVPPGIYHYNIKKFILEKVKEGERFGYELSRAALHQNMVSNAAATFLWSAVIPRSKWKYRQRCYRYIYLDAGHIGENLYLAAEALGLGCCTIGAFFDEEINRIIGLDGREETIVYLGVVGHVS